MNYIFIEMFSRGIKRKYFKSKKVARGLNFLILTHEMPVTVKYYKIWLIIFNYFKKNKKNLILILTLTKILI